VVGLLGVLAICLGIFVAIPVIYTANVLAYSMVFPRAGTAINYAPPSPDAYDDGSFGRGM
jgi:hypothetical protein